jgi:hypothetical protein
MDTPILPGLESPANKHPDQLVPIEEVVVRVEHTVENTSRLERTVVLGPLVSEFESSQFLTTLKRSIDYLNRQDKVMAMTMSFHLDNEQNVDLVVHKPYVLRKDQHGCVVRVYENLQY